MQSWGVVGRLWPLKTIAIIVSDRQGIMNVIFVKLRGNILVMSGRIGVQKDALGCK